MIEFLKVLGGFIKALAETGILAIIVAAAGWGFVYKNSRALQKRSETWAIVKNISDLLKDIELSSRKFWLPHDNKFINPMTYQVEINGYLSELERWLDYLGTRVPDSSQHSAVMIKIFREATYNLEKVKETKESQRMRTTMIVSKYTGEIKRIVDQKYESHFLHAKK
ncbi:hypothetical protein HVY60_05435 [Citrobacter freundii]|uniref:hypothetical protein n=1 Tax=Citrobacter freundii TaxID=546 RepID=UPI0015EF23DF|nr:hypothetical protein [Citrobacter freundii]QMG40059.1 hypothetical protein HVY60_05435 [Citrobacter freundii]